MYLYNESRCNSQNTNSELFVFFEMKLQKSHRVCEPNLKSTYYLAFTNINSFFSRSYCTFMNLFLKTVSVLPISLTEEDEKPPLDFVKLSRQSAAVKNM